MGVLTTYAGSFAGVYAESLKCRQCYAMTAPAQDDIPLIDCIEITKSDLVTLI
jgi:hypothetical protein